MRISLHLSENQNEVQKQIENCADILFRPLLIGEKEKTEAFLIYIEVAVSNLMLEDSVIGKLLNRLLSMDTKEIYGTLENNSLGISDTKELFTLEEAMAAMFAGNAVLFVDGYDRAIKIGSKGYPGSGVQKTDSEKGLRGSKEAFSESVKMNTALIRKRIRNAKMKAEEKQVGRYSATTTALLYLDGVVYLPICEEMRKRLDAFEVDGIEDGGMIEYLTRKKKEGRFPVYQTTERPDRAAQAILEGRVVLLTDNSPEALIFPATLNSLFQTADDYYRNERIVTFLRLIRYVAAFLALALPGLYVAAATFHPQLLPGNLIRSMAEARSGVPFPTAAEVLLMELSFELLREAGLRMPGPAHRRRPDRRTGGGQCQSGQSDHGDGGGSDGSWLLFNTKRRALRSIPALEIWNPAFGQLLWDSGRDAWLFSSADADGRAGKLRNSLALSLCGRQSQ